MPAWIRVVLVVVAIMVATIVALLLWPGLSGAEEESRPEGPRLEIVAERYWTEEGFNFEERLAKARAEEEARRQETRPVAESHEVPERMLEAAFALQPHLKRRPRVARRNVRIIFTAAAEAGVDPFLMLAFASRESALRAGVRGALDEQGLFQLHGLARRTCAKGRDLGQPRVNAEAFTCWWQWLRDECETEDVSVLVAAYGTGRCMEPDRARGLACVRRKRAELVKAVGEPRAAEVWPL